MVFVIQDRTSRTEFLESSHKIQWMQISHAVRKTTVKNSKALVFLSCTPANLKPDRKFWECSVATVWSEAQVSLISCRDIRLASLCWFLRAITS